MVDKRRLLADLKSLLETKNDVKEHGPWSDRGHRWLARGKSLLVEVDAGLAAQFGRDANSPQLGWGSWAVMIAIIMWAILNLEMELFINEHQRSRLPLVLAVIDIDRFKSVKR